MPQPVVDQLESFFAAQHPDAGGLHLEGLDTIEFGHSAEMLKATVVRTDGNGEHREDVVVRIRPRQPGLLEPYDMQRQFDVLRALADTPVKAPKALYLEPTGDVLGRPFFVMESLSGTVYERQIPPDLTAIPGRIRRMSESLVEQLAEIHRVDVRGVGLDEANGSSYLERELDHWESEINRVKRGPLPALERLLTELRADMPTPSGRVTLVHGDAKPGNFAYVDGEVSAVFDWELAQVGDPLADIGWLELLWQLPVGLPTAPDALTSDELVAHYEKVSGISTHDRGWYRAMQAFKATAINVVGVMLVDQGHSSDTRLIGSGVGIPLMTSIGLREMGITEELEQGPVTIRDERRRELGLEVTQR